MRCPCSTLRCAAAGAAVAFVLAASSGCATTRYYERERLQDRAMELDPDGCTVFIRTKMEEAREGSFGGFGANAVGGCGCQ